MATVLRYGRPGTDHSCLCEWEVPERRNIDNWCGAPATRRAVWDDGRAYHAGTNRNYLCDVHYREWEQRVEAPPAPRYEPVSITRSWVCEYNLERNRLTTQTWCRAPAVWELRLTGERRDRRLPNFLCDRHHRELVGEGELEVRTRTPPAAPAVTWEPCGTRESFHCEHPSCTRAMRERGGGQTWRATWRRHPTDESYTTPNFLCDAHYQEIVEAPQAEEMLRTVVSDSSASSFDRLVALTLTQPPQGGQTLRAALTGYLRMTNPQLSRLRGLWHEVASALVIRHLRRKGILDDLAVAHDVRVGNALAKAAGTFPATAPRRRTA